MAISLTHLQQALKTDRFQIESLIGAGGFGAVYLANDNELNRKVALKVLSAAPQKDMAARFTREAKALSLLNHKNIVQVYQFGIMDSHQPYLVLELVPGESLRQVIDEEKTLPCNQAVSIALQMAEALEHAHAQGIIHRDIKPENVMLVRSDDGILVRLLDFGICRVEAGEQSSTITKTGAIIGTPAYLSPEQCLGQPLDQRSDIYALGTVLFEMIAGRAPLIGDTSAATIWKHINDEAPDILALDKQAKLPALLKSILDKCLCKDPESRYQTMTILIADLEALKSLNSSARVVTERIEEAGTDRLKRQARTNHVAVKATFIAGLASVIATVALILYIFLGAPQQVAQVVSILPANNALKVLYARLQWDIGRHGREYSGKAASQMIKSHYVSSLPPDQCMDIVAGLYEFFSRQGRVPFDVLDSTLHKELDALKHYEDTQSQIPVSMYTTLRDLSSELLSRTQGEYKRLSWMSGYYDKIKLMTQLKEPNATIRPVVYTAFAAVMDGQPERTKQALAERTFISLAGQFMMLPSNDFDRYIAEAMRRSDSLGLDNNMAEAYMMKAAREFDVFNNRAKALEYYFESKKLVGHDFHGDSSVRQVLERKLFGKPLTSPRTVESDPSLSKVAPHTTP